LSGDTYTWNKVYIREGLSYYDPLVFTSVGGYRRHYLYDGLGSTRQLVNDAQNTTDTYSYEAFGNLMSSTGTTANPYKYVGSLGYYQTGSSLQHLGARYYMPDIGRFITQDPLGAGMNWYAYVENNPVGFVDPMGLTDEWWDLSYLAYMNPFGAENRAEVITPGLHHGLSALEDYINPFGDPLARQGWYDPCSEATLGALGRLNVGAGASVAAAGLWGASALGVTSVGRVPFSRLEAHVLRTGLLKKMGYATPLAKKLSRDNVSLWHWSLLGSHIGRANWFKPWTWW